jgi:hypothetical protein
VTIRLAEPITPQGDGPITSAPTRDPRIIWMRMQEEASADVAIP